MKNIVQKAAQIMVEAHGDQKRKTDDSPYIIHPMMVALKLRQHGFSDEVIAAGLTHDVLEDTDYPAEKLKSELGQNVYDIVKNLSEDKSLEWEERKENYVELVQQSSEETKAVSICDKIHNLENTISTHAQMGPQIWEKFNRGKDKKLWFQKKMLEMFQANWSHPLVEEYKSLLEKAERLD